MSNRLVARLQLTVFPGSIFNDEFPDLHNRSPGIIVNSVAKVATFSAKSKYFSQKNDKHGKNNVFQPFRAPK